MFGTNSVMRLQATATSRAMRNCPMNFGSGFNSCLSSSQPRMVMAMAPKAMAASSSPRRSNPWAIKLVEEIFRIPSLNRPAPMQQRQQNSREHGKSTGQRHRLGRGFFVAPGSSTRFGAQAPFAPERQRQQRRQKRARESGEKKIERENSCCRVNVQRPVSW